MSARVIPFARVAHMCARRFGGFCTRCNQRVARKKRWLHWSRVRGAMRRMLGGDLAVVACQVCRTRRRPVKASA